MNETIIAGVEHCSSAQLLLRKSFLSFSKACLYEPKSFTISVKLNIKQFQKCYWLIRSKNHISCRKYIKQWWVFWYAVDKPKEHVEQYRQRECLNGAVSKDKSLGDKKKTKIYIYISIYIEHIKGSMKIEIKLSKKHMLNIISANYMKNEFLKWFNHRRWNGQLRLSFSVHFQLFFPSV